MRQTNIHRCTQQCCKTVLGCTVWHLMTCIILSPFVFPHDETHFYTKFTVSSFSTKPAHKFDFCCCWKFDTNACQQVWQCEILHHDGNSSISKVPVLDFTEWPGFCFKINKIYLWCRFEPIMSVSKIHKFVAKLVLINIGMLSHCTAELCSLKHDDKSHQKNAKDWTLVNQFYNKFGSQWHNSMINVSCLWRKNLEHFCDSWRTFCRCIYVHNTSLCSSYQQMLSFSKTHLTAELKKNELKTIAIRAQCNCFDSHLCV